MDVIARGKEMEKGGSPLEDMPAMTSVMFQNAGSPKALLSE